MSGQKFSVTSARKNTESTTAMMAGTTRDGRSTDRTLRAKLMPANSVALNANGRSATCIQYEGHVPPMPLRSKTAHARKESPRT